MMLCAKPEFKFERHEHRPSKVNIKIKQLKN